MGLPIDGVQAVTRNLLRWLARGLIGSLLSMQIALAAHACMVGLGLPAAAGAAAGSELTASSTHGQPQVDPPPSLEVAAVGVQPCFESATGEASSSLCNEHCKRGQQSDQAASLVIPMVWLTARYVIAPALDHTPLRRPTADAASALAAGQPPHTLLHCVLRT